MSHTLKYGPDNVCMCRRAAELSNPPDIVWRSARQVTPGFTGGSNGSGNAGPWGTSTIIPSRTSASRVKRR